MRVVFQRLAQKPSIGVRQWKDVSKKEQMLRNISIPLILLDITAFSCFHASKRRIKGAGGLRMSAGKQGSDDGVERHRDFCS
jgi:hypothetical protein